MASGGSAGLILSVDRAACLLILLVLCAAELCRAQTAVNLKTQSRNIDFTLLSNTRPFAMGGSLPGTCVQGAMFFLTSATAGENVYGCASTNVWSLQGGSGSTPAVWGGITGTLSNQGDLSTALASKPTAALVTSIGTPGSDTNVPSEKAVRTLATAISEGAGTAWGMITGTLSSQTDLAAALAGKQASLGFTAENAANKDAHSGYAGLDSNGLLKVAEAPLWNQNTTGSASNAAAIGGVTVTGTPSVGYVPIATSSTAAAWGPQSGGEGGGGVWGSITGTLANQTDLEAALTARVVGTLVTSLGNPGTNGNVPTEEAVRSAIAALAPVWGGVGGTLANQTDLQSALNTKPTAALVTAIGTPGLDTNVPSEKAVRTALATVLAGTTIGVEVGGVTQGTQPSINFIAGSGIVQSCVNNNAQARVDCTPSFNTALIPTHDAIHANENYCASSNGTTGYTCSMPNKALLAYSAGQALLLKVDTTCSSSCSLNVDNVGVKSIKRSDGTTDPGGLLIAGRAQWVWYDGTVVRLLAPGATGANVTAVTVSANTTGDQVLQEVAISPAALNTLALAFKIHGSGLLTIGTAQTPTLTFKVELCTVSGCGSGTVITLASMATAATVAATNNPWNLNLVGATSATGSTGTVLVHGSLAVDIGAVATLPEAVYNDGNTAASSTIDLTGALYMDFTVATSAGSTLNSFTQQLAAFGPY